MLAFQTNTGASIRVHRSGFKSNLGGFGSRPTCKNQGRARCRHRRGERKCDHVKRELGFDDCLDHRDPNLAVKLKDACPKGIDVYFENVGGAVFDAVFPLLNVFARVPVCGLHYNDTEVRPPKWASSLMPATLIKRLTFRGFIVSDFAARHSDFLRDMSQWVREGKVKYKEFITEGLDSAPGAFMGLLKGANFGKQLVRVGPDRQ
ncbi:MAG TPA: zinc-binding dehydrogenase [Candidatus Binataceae bacterium]